MAGRQVKQVRKQASDLTAQMTRSWSEMFLAGLGVVSRFQREGATAVDRLAAPGRKVGAATQKAFEKAVREFRARPDVKQFEGKLQAFREESDARAKRIERAFQKASTEVLSRFGVATHKDLVALAHRLDRLTSLVEARAARRA
jgi:poly(hydroxyalkanoate) granule-associated protein